MFKSTQSDRALQNVMNGSKKIHDIWLYELKAKGQSPVKSEFIQIGQLLRYLDSSYAKSRRFTFSRGAGRWHLSIKNLSKYDSHLNFNIHGKCHIGFLHFKQIYLTDKLYKLFLINKN